jgi:tRNA-methyltransferase O
MDRVVGADFVPKVRPRERTDLPLIGVLATRGRQCPNPIGLAVVELLERRDARLRVRRLDAYAGTPVIDIKPYDSYDVFTEIKLAGVVARAPGYLARLASAPCPFPPVRGRSQFTYGREVRRPRRFRSGSLSVVHETARTPTVGAVSRYVI